MITRRHFFMILGGATLVGVFCFVILLLRYRTIAGIPSDTRPMLSARPTSQRDEAQPKRNLTSQERKRYEEVRELQQTLPKDIRETWTPEFRKRMETPNK